MTTIERCQLRNCVYFVVINDGNNFFAETQFLAKSTEAFKSHSKTVDKIDLCGNFWFCFGKIELLNWTAEFLSNCIKLESTTPSVRCVFVLSHVFLSESHLQFWMHEYIPTSTLMMKAKASSWTESDEKSEDCVWNWWNGFLECHIALKYVLCYTFMSLWLRRLPNFEFRKCVHKI